MKRDDVVYISKQSIELLTLIKNAKLFGLTVGTARRFNGAVAHCPEIFQIRIGKEFHGWFQTRNDASAFIAKGEARLNALIQTEGQVQRAD